MTAPARLSYSHGASPDPLLGETIGDNLRRIAAQYPGREVLVDVPTGGRWTYARFDADTDTLARGLIAAGCRSEERRVGKERSVRRSACMDRGSVVCACIRGGDGAQKR